MKVCFKLHAPCPKSKKFVRTGHAVFIEYSSTTAEGGAVRRPRQWPEMASDNLRRQMAADAGAQHTGQLEKWGGGGLLHGSSWKQRFFVMEVLHPS